MRLLQIIGTLKPSYGGPVEALHQVNRALAGLGHRSETVTLDDHNAPGVDAFPGTVHSFGPSWGKYQYNSLACAVAEKKRATLRRDCCA